MRRKTIVNPGNNCHRIHPVGTKTTAFLPGFSPNGYTPYSTLPKAFGVGLFVVNNAVKSIDVDRLRIDCFIYSTPTELGDCGRPGATGETGGYPHSTLAGLCVGNNHGNPLIKLIIVQTITTGGYPHLTLAGRVSKTLFQKLE